MKLLTASVINSVLLMSLAASSAQGADASNQYRWLDDRGAPVYSDRPPPKGVDYEVISAGSSLKRVVSAEEGAVPPETQPRAGNEFNQVDASAGTRTKKNTELCQRARTNLEALSSSVKVKVRNEKGEVRYLNPEEMEIERQTAQAQISVYCE